MYNQFPTDMRFPAYVRFQKVRIPNLHSFYFTMQPRWLFDMGDYTAQLYGDYFIRNEPETT